MANDSAVLYLMTMKPALGGSLLVVIAVNLVVAAVRASRRGYRYGPRGAKPLPASAG